MRDVETGSGARRTSFSRYAAAVFGLIVASAALGASGLQFSVAAVVPVTASPDGAASPVLDSAEPSRARRLVTLPPRSAHPHASLRASARLGGDAVDAGPDPARPPILATWFTRADGSRHDVSPSPLPDGTFDDVRWSTIRAWPDDVDGFVAALLPREANGRFVMRDLAVDIVVLSPLYKVLVSLLIVAGATAGLVAADYVRRRLSGPAVLVPFALVAIIGAFAVFSADIIDTFIRPIVSLAHGTRGGVSLVATFKIGHGVAFALLTLSLIAVRRRLALSLPRIVVLVALLALASEAIQLHLPARTARAGDLLIDLIGVLVAIGIWSIARAYRRRRRSPEGAGYPPER